MNGIHEVRGSIPLASTVRLGYGGSGCGNQTHRGQPYTGDRLRVRFWRHAGIAQLVEHNLAKVGVAGSSPVSRSLVRSFARFCVVLLEIGEQRAVSSVG